MPPLMTPQPSHKRPSHGEYTFRSLTSELIEYWDIAEVPARAPRIDGRSKMSGSSSSATLGSKPSKAPGPSSRKGSGSNSSKTQTPDSNASNAPGPSNALKAPGPSNALKAPGPSNALKAPGPSNASKAVGEKPPALNALKALVGQPSLKRVHGFFEAARAKKQKREVAVEVEMEMEMEMEDLIDLTSDND